MLLIAPAPRAPPLPGSGPLLGGTELEGVVMQPRVQPCLGREQIVPVPPLHVRVAQQQPHTSPAIHSLLLHAVHAHRHARATRVELVHEAQVGRVGKEDGAAQPTPRRVLLLRCRRLQPLLALALALAPSPQGGVQQRPRAQRRRAPLGRCSALDAGLLVTCPDLPLISRLQHVDEGLLVAPAGSNRHARLNLVGRVRQPRQSDHTAARPHLLRRAPRKVLEERGVE